MRSHIPAHSATIKFCANPLVFRNTIEKEGLPRDSAPDLGVRSSVQSRVTRPKYLCLFSLSQNILALL
jgi:hypothetical protein